MARTPLGHLATAADIGDAIVMLCGDGPRFITGEVITLDGGMSRSTA